MDHHVTIYVIYVILSPKQVLEEAMKHKRETARSIDSIQFKLQKPISKDESRSKAHRPKKRWWRSALLFFGGAGPTTPLTTPTTITTTTSTRPGPGPSGHPSRARSTGPRPEAVPPRPTAPPAAPPPGHSPEP